MATYYGDYKEKWRAYITVTKDSTTNTQVVISGSYGVAPNAWGYDITSSDGTFSVSKNGGSYDTKKTLTNVGIQSSTGSSTKDKHGSFSYTYSRGASAVTYKYRYKHKNSSGYHDGTSTATSDAYTVPALPTYTVTFVDGFGATLKTQTVYYGYDATPPANPSRADRAFAGWNGTYTGVTSNRTITATWGAVYTYTIKYDANGGTGAPANFTKTYGVNAILSSTVPTRANETDANGATLQFTFRGWGWNRTTGVDYNKGAAFNQNAAGTLYAIWSSSEVGNWISYNANGGTGAPEEQFKNIDAAVTISTVKPTRNYFNLKSPEWNTDIDGNGISYSSGASYNINADLLLYAQWAPWQHTITFDLNGGSGESPNSLTKIYGTTLLIPEQTPTKTFAVFDYWADTPSGISSFKYIPGGEYTYNQNGGTITLYARWKERQVLIYKNKNIEATEFIENGEYSYTNEEGVQITETNLTYIDNWGKVYNTEFIEDDSLYIEKTSLHCKELIEK